MPKLSGYRMRRPFDVYDSFAFAGIDGRALSAGAIMLFGNTNIGLGHLSNMQVPGQLNGADMTSVICNWYARTNIPMPPAFSHPSYTPAPDVRPTELEQAFAEFAASTIVTMLVGERPEAQLPLDQLLRRRHGDRPMAMTAIGGGPKQIMETPPAPVPSALAALMYEDYRLAGGTGHQWEDIPDSNRLGIAEHTKTHWIAAARCALNLLNEPAVTIVPVRQNCGAIVNFVSTSLGKLRELMPKTIAPMPLVWIHYDGFYVRDVC